MLLSKLHIHKVKDLYHLSPLFFELQKFPSFLPVVALQSFNLSKISLDFFFWKIYFFFHRSHFVILVSLHIRMPFSYGWIAVLCLRNVTTLFIDHNLRPSWNTCNSSTATKMSLPWYHLPLPPFFSSFVVFQGYHFSSSEALLIYIFLPRM